MIIMINMRVVLPKPFPFSDLNLPVHLGVGLIQHVECLYSVTPRYICFIRIPPQSLNEYFPIPTHTIRRWLWCRAFRPCRLRPPRYRLTLVLRSHVYLRLDSGRWNWPLLLSFHADVDVVPSTLHAI